MTFQDRFSAAPTQDKTYLGDEPVGPQLKKRLAGAAERPTYTFTTPTGAKVKASFEPGTTGDEALEIFVRKYDREKQGYSSIFGGGLLKGAMGALSGSPFGGMQAGLSSDITQAITGQHIPTPTEPYEQGLEKYFPTPEDPTGRAVQGLGEALGDPLTYATGGGKAATSIGKRALDYGLSLLPSISGAIGGEEAGLISGDDPTAKLIGGAIGGVIPRGVGRLTENMRESLPIPYRTPASRDPNANFAQRFASGLARGIGKPEMPTGPGPQGAVARRLFGTIPEENVEPVRTLNEHGVYPKASDMLNSELLRSLERHGDRIAGGKSYSRGIREIEQQFTGAVARGFGSTAKILNDDVIKAAKKNLSNRYEKTLPKIRVPFIFGQHNLGDKLTLIVKEMSDQGEIGRKNVPRLTDLQNRIMDMFVTKGPKVPSKAELDQLLREAQDPEAMMTPISMQPGKKQAWGEMRGDKYKTLTMHNGELDRAINSGDPEVSFWAARMKQALDEHVRAASQRPGTRPNTGQRKAFADYQEINKQYWTLAMVQKALSGSGKKPAKGILLPERMRQALEQHDKFTQYVQGRTDLHKLTRAAQAIISPQVASTGYESLNETLLPKALIGTALGTGHMGLAALGALYQGTTGRIVNSRLFQDWLTNQRMSRVIQNMMSMREAAARGAFTADPFSERKREPTKIGTITPSRYGGTSE